MSVSQRVTVDKTVLGAPVHVKSWQTSHAHFQTIGAAAQTQLVKQLLVFMGHNRVYKSNLALP